MAGLNRCIDKHRLMIPIVYLLTDESSRECRVWLNLTLLVTTNIFLDRYVARFLQISLHCIDFCDSTKKFSETDIFIILFFFIANLFVDMFFFFIRHSTFLWVPTVLLFSSTYSYDADFIYVKNNIIHFLCTPYLCNT